MISFLSRTKNFFFFFLSLWIYLWLAETSQQPISQTTWLKLTPHCNQCNHCCWVCQVCIGGSTLPESVGPVSVVLLGLYRWVYWVCWVYWVSVDLLGSIGGSIGLGSIGVYCVVYWGVLLGLSYWGLLLGLLGCIGVFLKRIAISKSMISQSLQLLNDVVH